MYYFKKRTTLITLSVLLLVSSSPTKNEPATLVVGGVCLAGGVLIGYLCSGSKEKLPLPEHAVIETDSVQERIKREHSPLFTANTQQKEDSFRKKLRPLFSDTNDVDDQERRLQTSESEIDEQLRLLQKIKEQKKKPTTEQKILLSRKEEELKGLLRQVRYASDRFKKNKSYFNLNARLNEAQKAQSFTRETYPLIAKDNNLQSRRDRLANIAQAARELGYGDIGERAEYVEQSLRQEQINLHHSPQYHNESQDKREHARQIDVQKQMNAELERQRDKDRAVRQQEIALEKYRNAMRQEEIDLETGATKRRIREQLSNEYRNILAQKDTKLRQCQNSLSQTQEALDSSLARERNSNNQLAEKARRVVALQKQLRRLQAREREHSNNNSRNQEDVKRCNEEGCIIPNCTGHPKPSAPPHQREGARSGPPPAATGTTRR